MPSIPSDICEIPDRDGRREGKPFHQYTVSWHDCPAFLGLGITAAGETHAGPGFSVSHTPTSNWIVMGTIAGEAQAAINGRWRAWKPGWCLVLPPSVRHHYRQSDGIWNLVWVVFRGSDEALPRGPTLVRSDPSSLAAAIAGCHRERGSADQTEVQHHWGNLVSLLARRALGDHEDAWLHGLWDAVVADLARPWTLRDLARQVDRGVESLRLAVHRATGRSPMAHLTWLRMRRAATRLAAGDEVVAAIAADLGYENPFAFSVAFKRTMGVSPAHYRGARRSQYLIPGDPRGRAPSRGGRGVIRKTRP